MNTEKLTMRRPRKTIPGDENIFCKSLEARNKSKNKEGEEQNNGALSGGEGQITLKLMGSLQGFQSE